MASIANHSGNPLMSLKMITDSGHAAGYFGGLAGISVFLASRSFGEGLSVLSDSAPTG